MLFWLFPLVTSCCYASLSGFFIFLSACLQASYTMLTSWTCLGSLDLCSQTLWCTAREPNQALLVGGWVCYKVDNQQNYVYKEVVSCLTHMSMQYLQWDVKFDCGCAYPKSISVQPLKDLFPLSLLSCSVSCLNLIQRAILVFCLNMLSFVWKYL